MSRALDVACAGMASEARTRADLAELSERILPRPFRVGDLEDSRGRLSHRRITRGGWTLLSLFVLGVATTGAALVTRSPVLAMAGMVGTTLTMLACAAVRLIRGAPMLLQHEPGHRIATADSVRRHRVAVVATVGASGHVEATATVIEQLRAPSSPVHGEVRGGRVGPCRSRADHLVALGDRYHRVSDFSAIDLATAGPFAHHLRRWSQELPVPIVTRHESEAAALAQLDWEFVTPARPEALTYR